MPIDRLKTRPECPTCQSVLDGFASVNHEHSPKTGDITICIHCAEVLTFDRVLELKKATQEEIEQAGPEGIEQAKKVIKDFQRNRRN